MLRSWCVIPALAFHRRMCRTFLSASTVLILPAVAIREVPAWAYRLRTGLWSSTQERSRLKVNRASERLSLSPCLSPRGLLSPRCPLLSEPSARTQPNFSNVCHAVRRKKAQQERSAGRILFWPGKFHYQDGSAEMTEGEHDEEPTDHITGLRLELRWRRGTHYRACSGPDTRSDACVRQSCNRDGVCRV